MDHTFEGLGAFDVATAFNDHDRLYLTAARLERCPLLHERCGQWVKGKSFDTFAPLGPWLVTPDEVPNPRNLKLWLDVNNTHRQDANTSDMIFGVRHLVSDISRYMTLLPGDVFATGTPPGVGLGHEPPIFLKPGDVMRLGVEGLGEQRQEVKAWEDR